MAVIQLPYGKTGMTAEIPDQNLAGIYESFLPPAAADPAKEVADAMDHPIGSLPLEDLAKGKRSVVIIASDHTRPVPSRIMMPEILRRLRAGNPEIDVTILIATGCHRETTRAELADKFGPEIVAREKIVIHDSTDDRMMIKCGVLPSGGDLVLNKLAVEADLLVAEGFIEPHFFAGFSGGRKSVLPGIAAKTTVLANHCAEFIRSPFARTGNLDGNPIHEDMIYAAKKAKLAFIVNVVINGKKEIVRAFAGDMENAHMEGCRFLRSCCCVKVPEADIVITTNGGYPLDQNIYQSVKGMTAGEAVCRAGGVIILAASCADGHGGTAFCETLTRTASPDALLNEISSIPRDQTKPDQWQYQILARILNRFHVILVTKDCDHGMIRNIKMMAASDIGDALDMAFRITGANAKIAVIPDGVSVVAEKQ